MFKLLQKLTAMGYVVELKSAGIRISRASIAKVNPGMSESDALDWVEMQVQEIEDGLHRAITGDDWMYFDRLN